MGNIDNININWIIVVDNTLHDLGITIIKFCIVIDNKKKPNNLQCDANDTICFSWPEVVDKKVPKMHFTHYLIQHLMLLVKCELYF
jgi:hypothetical protein